MTTESQRYNCFTKNGGNAIPKHAGPKAKGSNPNTGLTLLWVRNPFRGNFNHCQVSRKEAGRIQVRSCLYSVRSTYKKTCLDLCDPRRSRLVNTLALLIVYT